MRRARPHELRAHAVPVMTARMSEAELGRWLPVRFEEINDPLAAAEPPKAALVQLDSGGTAHITQDSLQNTYQRMD